MGSELATTNNAATVVTSKTMETVLVTGDLSGLSPEQRLSYYKAVCESLELNPLTKPFAYIKLNNALQLYALKGATDQIREKRHVQITQVEKERIDDLYVVTAHARLPDGRTDSDIGAVSIAGLKGESLANAMMKAITKAKRRVTLSICGMGMLDESEAESIPANQRQFVEVDHETGEIVSEEPRRASSVSGPDTPMTPNQKRYIESLGRDIGIGHDGVTEAVHKKYQKNLADLTKAEASALIESLQAIKDDQSLAGFTDHGDKTLEKELGIDDANANQVAKPEVQPDPSPVDVEPVTGDEYDQLQARLSESGDSATLADAWTSVETAGLENDPVLHGIAYDLMQAFLGTADDMPTWSRAMNDARSMRIMDDELKAAAQQRQRDLKQAKQAS